MDRKKELECEITDIILEVADMKTEVPRSDLQGIAQARAKRIIKKVEK